MNLNIFQNIKSSQRKKCVICNTKFASPLIKLTKFPLTEIYVPRYRRGLGFVDQAFYYCQTCGQGQLGNIIDQQVLYGSTYKTRTSTSASAVPAVDVFLNFIREILRNRRIKNVLEIGCNDLYTLKKLKAQAQLLYGIDPILKGKEKYIKDAKIKVIGDFFENVDLQNLGVSFDIVLSSHTLEHMEQPKAVIKKIVDAVGDKTLVFFQFPSLEELVQDAHFDQIFHQHLNYFSLSSVLYLLDKVGAELVDYRINPYHWGALMIAFQKKSQTKRRANYRKKIRLLNPEKILAQFTQFKKCMEITSRRIEAFADKTIYGYGAAFMLPVLAYYVPTLNKLRNILDEDPEKAHKYYLNFPVQIRQPREIADLTKSVVVVTAINSMQPLRAIISKLISLRVEKIIIPANLV